MAEGRRQGHRVLAYEVWRMAMGEDGSKQTTTEPRTSDGRPVTMVQGEQAAQVWDAAMRYFPK